MILIDIGAAGEILPRFSKIKDKTIIAFEPEEKAFNKLIQKYSADNHIILQEALSRKKQDVELKITKKGQCSSLLEPNMELLNTFPASERFEVETRQRLSTDSWGVDCLY